MDGAHPTGAGGDPPVTDMVTIMVIAMAITTVIVPDIVLDIMQVVVTPTTGLLLIPPEPGPQIMLITIVPRGLEIPEINNIIPGQATELLRRIDPDPQHNPPTDPTICIRIAMGMSIGKMEMIGTG